MIDLARELRHGVRSLCRSPGFTVSVVALTGLTIATLATVFSMADSVFLRPLPFERPDRLVYIEKGKADGRCVDGCELEATTTGLHNWSAQVRSVAELAAGRDYQVVVRTPASTTMPIGAAVTENFFSVLGVSAAVGRVFHEDDGVSGTSNVVVLSHAFWESEFGGDSAVVGTRITLGSDLYSVVGVASPAGDVGAPMFETDDSQVAYFIPVREVQQPEPESAGAWMIVGRLAAGHSAQELEARLTPLVLVGLHDERRWTRRIPADLLSTAHVMSLAAAYARPFAAPYHLLVSAALFIGIVAAANLAGLLLARREEREHEAAVRIALGATRARLFRQSLVEGLLLSFAGCVVGLGLTLCCVSATRFLPSTLIPYWAAAAVNTRVIAASGGLSTMLGLMFAGASAILSSPPGPALQMRRASQTSRTATSFALTRLLVALELGCTLPLLGAATIFATTLVDIVQRDPGVAEHSVVEAQLYARDGEFRTGDQERALANSVLDGVSRVSGAVQVGIAGRAEGPAPTEVQIATSLQTLPKSDAPRALVAASVQYFKAAGIHLIMGRQFLPADRLGGVPVTIIDQTAQANWFHGANPIGQRIKFGADATAFPWMLIVGVVAVAGGSRLTPEHAPRPTVYVPLDQLPTAGLGIVVRTRGPSVRAIPAIRAALHAAAPTVPISVLRTVESRLSRETAPLRAIVVIVGVFAIMSLILAILGVYCVVSYIVVQRRGEFAIRLALGASPSHVIRVAFHGIARMLASGLIAGVIGTVLLARVVESRIYGVSLVRPPELAAVVVALIAAALLAGFVPAYRVTRLSLALALRD